MAFGRSYRALGRPNVGRVGPDPSSGGAIGRGCVGVAGLPRDSGGTRGEPLSWRTLHKNAARRTTALLYPMTQKPRVSDSTGQGVGGNAESEGPLTQAPRPKRKRTESSVVAEERPSPIWGKSSVAYSGDVREVGMGVSGPHGDPGKPSVHPPRVKEGVPSERSEVAKARDSEAVGELKEVSREDQGGRWSRSTDGASCNGSGKGSWSTEEDRKRPADDVRKERDAWWEEPRPPSAQGGHRTVGSGDPLGRSVSLGRRGTQDPPLRTGRDSVARETRPLRWGWRTAGRKPRLRPYAATNRGPLCSLRPC